MDNESVDIVDDVSKLIHIEKESVDLIYACHILEHFKRKEYFNILERWTQLLKPGGKLRLSVPDLEKVAQLYINGEFELEKMIGLIYGGQTYLYNFHYMGFDFKSLRKDLKKLKYTNIKRYDWKETEHASIDDYSQAYLPHMDKENGILMSLNVEAIKL